MGSPSSERSNSGLIAVSDLQAAETFAETLSSIEWAQAFLAALAKVLNSRRRHRMLARECQFLDWRTVAAAFFVSSAGALTA